MDADRPKEELYPELFPKDFGRRLERLTEIAGLSWEEFAVRLGVNEGRVMEWRNGTIPTGGEVWRIVHLAGSVPGGMDLLLADDEE